MPEPTTTTSSPSTLSHYTKAPIIETTGITKVYKVGKQMITPISDISLQIGYGDFVALFGPSGSGKSTLVNILLGIEKPDIGQVFLKAESFYDFSAEERAMIRLKRFGIVPQNQYWLEHLTILDNVALPLILQGQTWSLARKKAQSILEEIKMGGLTKHRPYELSGGQQQKASIARGLVNDPWIVFADEPTEHLDTESAQEVLDLLVQANQRDRRTVIMVTHDLQFLKVCKKWFFVNDGRIWDIKHQKSPFTSIKEAIGYIEDLDKEGEKEE